MVHWGRVAAVFVSGFVVGGHLARLGLPGGQGDWISVALAVAWAIYFGQALREGE